VQNYWRLKEFSDFIVFLIVSDEEVRVYKPAHLDIENIITRLQEVIDVAVEDYTPNAEKLDEITKYIEEVISERGIWPWSIGFFTSRLIRNYPDFVQLALKLGLSIDYSAWIYGEPSQYLPLIATIYTALKRVAKSMEKPKHSEVSTAIQPREEMVRINRVELIEQPKEIVEEPRMYLERPKHRTRKVTVYRAIDIKKYIARRVIKYVIETPIIMEKTAGASGIVKLRIVLQELHKILMKNPYPTELIDDDEAKILCLYHVGVLKDFYYALIEAKYLLDKTNMGAWLILNEQIAILGTSWKTSLILIITKDTNELTRIIEEILRNKQGALSS